MRTRIAAPALLIVLVVAAGILAGMCATLVHNLIGFSMLTPAGLSIFVGLGACAVGCTYGLVAPGVVKAAGPDHIIETAGALADLFPSRPLP